MFTKWCGRGWDEPRRGYELTNSVIKTHSGQNKRRAHYWYSYLLFHLEDHLHFSGCQTLPVGVLLTREGGGHAMYNASISDGKSKLLCKCIICFRVFSLFRSFLVWNHLIGSARPSWLQDWHGWQSWHARGRWFVSCTIVIRLSFVIISSCITYVAMSEKKTKWIKARFDDVFLELFCICSKNNKTSQY